MNKQDQLRLLALLLSKPKGFIGEQVASGNINKVIEEAFPNYDIKSLDTDIKDSIIHDNTYLFVGASKPLASPYASSYYGSNNRLMDQPARVMINMMKKWGIQISDDFKDLPDHIITMISVMAELEELKSKIDDNSVLIEEIDNDIEGINKILRGFLPEFYNKIKENETVEFYSIIVDLLMETVEI